MSGESYTKESEILEYYEKNKFKNDDDIIKFLEDCLNVIEANITIREAFTNIDLEFTKKFKKHEQSKIRSLFFLAEKMIKTSDNCRFLFYRNALENFPDENYLFILSLWNNIRLTLYFEVFKNETSNIIREEYLKIIKDKNSINLFLQKDFLKINSLNLDKSGINQLNIIRNKNSDKSQFILCFYSYIKNPESLLLQFNPNFIKFVEVEHCIPKKWKKHWNNEVYEFNFEDVKSYLVNYNFDTLNKLESKNIRDLIYMRNKDIELPQDESPDEDCIIEFIGNKWLLHSANNKKASNNNWLNKKERIFENDEVFKFPNNEDKLVGFKIYKDTNFTFKEIIDRSFKITNEIITNFEKNWDNQQL